MLSTLHESILTFSSNLVSKAMRKAVARVASGRGKMRRSACYWEVDLPQGFEGMEYPSTRPSLEPPPESFENWTPKNVNYIILNKSLLNIKKNACKKVLYFFVNTMIYDNYFYLLHFI